MIVGERISSIPPAFAPAIVVKKSLELGCLICVVQLDRIMIIEEWQCKVIGYYTVVFEQVYLMRHGDFSAFPPSNCQALLGSS